MDLQELQELADQDLEVDDVESPKKEKDASPPAAKESVTEESTTAATPASKQVSNGTLVNDRDQLAQEQSVNKVE